MRMTSSAMQKRMTSSDMGQAGALEFIGYLDDPNNDFVRITVLIQQIEFHHGVVTFNIAFDVNYFVTLEMLLDFLLQDKQRIRKINFRANELAGFLVNHRRKVGGHSNSEWRRVRRGGAPSRTKRQEDEPKENQAMKFVH